MDRVRTPIRISLGHSPDPDDAFMWWPLFGVDGGPPAVECGRFQFHQVADDIESLNRRAAGPEEALLDVTAISAANWALVRERYLLTACGASVGDGYGPKLVARRMVEPEALAGARVAVPGRRTTAFVAASLLLGPGRFQAVEVPFDRIEESVAAGDVDAGVVIHEGQLTFQDKGLVLVRDLGRWWLDRTGLPLPLGVNAIRRDLDRRAGPGAIVEVAALLRRSLAHAMAHRAESLAYALRFARGLAPQTADRFVEMYVNHWTLDFGERGRAAVLRLIGDAAAAGLLPPVSEPDLVPA